MESVPKIEGHAAFYTHLKNGAVDQARLIGMENDRFVEKILFGRKYYEAPVITSRICGICPTIHSITSTQAIEIACGINPSAQTKKLRRLMLDGQMIQSHSLHLYLLVLPDFVGVGSSFELQKSHPAIFGNAIKLKRYADSILEIIGGRAVHPISSVPGGFKHFPTKKELQELLRISPEAENIAYETVKMFAGFHYPELSREMIYGALSDKDYNIYEGTITTTNGSNFNAKDYKNYIYEELKPYTRAKFATLKGFEMMVGAMARLNINSKKLAPGARKILDELNIDLPLNNPFYNIIAQAIENYHFVMESKSIIEELIKEGVDRKDPVKLPKEFGEGVSACEAPRGTLFHYYKLDKAGDIVKCDIITPTVQNLPALEFDMQKLGPLLDGLDKEEGIKLIEMLIRAYDPCITCATH
jgi:coenzyme F420-reducing hydrogenase alpha subunit